MRIIIAFLVVFFSLTACQNDSVGGDDGSKGGFSLFNFDVLKTDADTVNYALGVVIGTQMKKYGITQVDDDILRQAIDDVLDDDQDLLIHPDVARYIVNLYVNKKSLQKEINDDVSRNTFRMTEYEEVIKLESGIEYKILKSGAGEQPALSDRVTVHYRGELPTGEVITDTYSSEPAQFRVMHSIEGWQKVLVNMHEGDEWLIFLSPEHAFGAEGNNKVPPNAFVSYKIQLISVEKR